MRQLSNKIAKNSNHYGKFLVQMNDTGVSKTLRQGCIYQPHILSYLEENIKEGMTVVDIGAHIGCFTIPMAHMVGDTGKVYAFESNRINFQYLVANIAINGLMNVYPHHVGIFNKDGFLNSHRHNKPINYFKGQNTGGYGLTDKDVTKSAETTIVHTLDCYHISPNLIKIDVEDNLIQCLQGCIETLQRSRPIIIIEIDSDIPSQIDFLKLSVIQFLENINYTLIRLHNEDYIGIPPTYDKVVKG